MFLYTTNKVISQLKSIFLLTLFFFLGRVKKMKIAYQIIALVCLICVNGVCSADDDLWAIAFYTYWAQYSMPADAIDFEAVTHVAHFCMNPSTNGDLDRSYFTDQQIRNTVKTVHDAGRKILITIGEAGSGSKFQAATTDANRAKFISQIVDAVQKYGYDGVDIDWEASGDPGSKFTVFIKELHQAMNDVNPNWLLTADVAPYSHAPKTMAEVADEIDSFNTMTYWSSLNVHIEPYMDAGIPASKLTGGVGLGDDGGIDTTPEKVRIKLEYAKQMGLRGIMMWEIDDIYRKSTEQGIYDVIKEYVSPPGPTAPAAPKNFHVIHTS